MREGFTGTTYGGGIYTDGTVFELKTGKEKVLHNFEDGADGAWPESGLILDKARNIYGTARGGGDGRYGTIFKLDTAGTFTTLYTFTGGADGGGPEAALLFDEAGDLYGTTSSGIHNFGTIFKLDATGILTTLYTFMGGVDGGSPYSWLIFDKAGTLYGTTSGGGLYGHGTIFKLDTAGTLTTLYSFCSQANCADGENPMAGLVRDQAGNLYGTAPGGGGPACSGGCGTIFKLDKKGVFSVLHTFTGGADGAIPYAGLVLDKEGNLYGTTQYGGNNGCVYGYGCGTVFKLNAAGALTNIHTFTGAADGANPYAGLILDKEGNLYGAASDGGSYGKGVAFKITPQ